MPNTIYTIEECKALLTEAQSGFGTRKKIFDDQENMYFLKDSTLPEASHIKKVIAPDPRNYVQGAVRLLTATHPHFSVAREVNVSAMDDISSTIEKVCEAILTVSGTITNRPVEVEAALSAFLYGEVHIKVINTKAMLEATTGTKKIRAEYTNKRTPLLLQVVNPKIGFPLYDINGLSTYCSVESVMVDFIRSKYGEDKMQGKKITEKVDLNELWSDSTHAVWVNSETDPFLLEENKLGFIPVFCEIVEGSDFFVETTQPSRQPLMYTYKESGLWNAQNLALTVMNSLAFAIGAMPMMKFEMGQMGDVYEVEHTDLPWGIVKVPPGAKFDSLLKQVIDPSILKINEIAEQKGMESSIYRQTLGEPMGNNAAFSMVSLLSSAGRLPLVPYVRCISHVLGKAMYGGLKMMRDGGIGKSKIAGTSPTEIDFSSIPEDFILECNVEVSVPQDERQNMAVAVQATSGDNPLMSLETARNKFLNMGQSDMEQTKIWKEQRLQLMNTAELQAIQNQAAENIKNGLPPNQDSSLPGQNQPGDTSASPQANLGQSGPPMASPQLPQGTFGKNENGVR
jgi:hypothetical protein